jgi:hypothetical protein
MIERTTQASSPIREAMTPYFHYCRVAAPHYGATWDSLERLNFDSDFAGLTDWLKTLLATDPPPDDVNGLWFGLYNPCLDDGTAISQLYLSGSKRFEKSDPHSDWPCGPEYWPDGRYSPSSVLATIYRATNLNEDEESILGEACLCHGYVAAVLSKWCLAGNTLSAQLTGVNGQRAVAFGHDSGDRYFVNQPH